MKKSLLYLGIAVLVLMPPAFAEDSWKDQAAAKFGRGMANIFISPGEFYTQPVLMTENHEAPIAIFGGLLKGGGMFLARECTGIYEVLTFPFPIPKDYKPIIQPPTTFTDWDTRRPKV